jgi:hypothetical protein
MSRFPPRLAARQGKWYLPDKEFRLSLTWNLQADGTSLLVPSLHVAMQTGPSHHPVSRMSGVWPLRILINSCLGFWRFIV